MMKPAPIQVTYIGYQNTTGMLAMDYRLTDDYADPPGVTRNMGSTTAVSAGGAFVAPPGTVWLTPGNDGTPRNFATA